MIKFLPMDEFNRAMQRVMQGVTAFRAKLTPRDSLMLQIGMRASHIEEALAQGDTARAQTHVNKLGELIQNHLPYA